MNKKSKITENTTPATELFPMPPALLKIPRKLNPQARTYRASVYCAGSRGLMNFLIPLGIQAFKIGVTGCISPQARIEDLRRKGYANLWGPVDGTLEDCRSLDQAEEWFLMPWREHDLADFVLPEGIHLVDGALEVELPFGIHVEDLDRAVHGLLAPRALDKFLASAEGRKRLEKTGFEPQGFEIKTKYTLMEVTDRLSAVREIYITRPRIELCAFVNALEKARRVLIENLRDERANG